MVNLTSFSAGLLQNQNNPMITTKFNYVFNLCSSVFICGYLNKNDISAKSIISILVSLLIGLAILPLMIALFETILWWYKWNKQSYQIMPSPTYWTKAIVFITGISDYTATTLQPEQISFLDDIVSRYPVDIVLAEPFPYESSTAQKFARFDIWRNLGFKESPVWVWALHNFWQTALTIWFKKAYGAAVARCIINRIGLPKPDNNSTLIFICGSAGAAIALAAAPMLNELLQVRLIILSYGGVFGSSPGFDSVANFYQLIGEKDNWAKLGAIVFPGRWLPIGAFSRAKKSNRYSVHYTGSHTHFGLEGYLSDRSAQPNQKTYRDLTLETVTKLPIL
jgi:hypothetical protein